MARALTPALVLVLTLAPVVALALAFVWLASAQASAAAASSVRVAAPQSPADPEIAEEQLKAAEEFAGAEGKVSAVKVLVTHPGDEFEWIVLCVAVKPDGESTALVDSDGRVYEGGIDDFRAHNELLSEDDKITYNRHIDSPDPPENVETITKSGHTGMAWWPWITGGSAVVVIAGVLFFVRRARVAAFREEFR